MSALSQSLLIVALQSTLLLTVFLGALRWWRANPFSRHTLGSVAITSCMLLPLCMWLVPATITAVLTKPETQVTSSAAMSSNVSISQSRVGPVSSVVSEEPIAPATHSQILHPEINTSSMPWNQIILVLWAIGCAVMIAIRMTSN